MSDHLDRAQRLLEKAKTHCLISNSIKANVVMDATISVAEMAGKAG